MAGYGAIGVTFRVTVMTEKDSGYFASKEARVDSARDAVLFPCKMTAGPKKGQDVQCVVSFEALSDATRARAMDGASALAAFHRLFESKIRPVAIRKLHAANFESDGSL